MSELDVRFTDPDTVEVSHGASGALWTFRVVKDGSGRRHLDGPHGTDEAMARGDIVRQACASAQSEALHAGKTDY